MRPDQTSFIAADALTRADVLSRTWLPEPPPSVTEALRDALGVDSDRPDMRLRRVPSAGGLHPVGVLVRVRRAGVAATFRWKPNGVLVPLHVAETGSPGSSVDVALAAHPSRSIAKYGIRSLSQVVLDVGYAASAIAHAARSHDLSISSSDATWAKAFEPHVLAAGRLVGDERPPPPAREDRVDDPGVAPVRGNSNPVSAALDVLTGYTQSLPHAGNIPIEAIRARRSAALADLTDPAPVETISRITSAATRDMPRTVAIWKATATTFTRLEHGEWSHVMDADYRPMLAQYAGKQLNLSGVPDIIVLTAPPAGSVPDSEWAASRLAVAHVAHGILLGATADALGSRPVGGWTSPPGDEAPIEPRKHWERAGHVAVHGVALGRTGGVS